LADVECESTITFSQRIRQDLITFEQKATHEMFVAFFRRISDVANDESSIVGEAALEMVRNQQLYQVLKGASPSVFDGLTLEVHIAAKTHWNGDIREDAVAALEVVKGVDRAVFAKAVESLGMAKARRASAFAVCKGRWARVAVLGQDRDALIRLSGNIDQLRTCL
jgi:hypothetical protein